LAIPSWLLAILELDDDWSVLPACLQFFGSATSIPSVAQAKLKTFRQEIENIEDR